MPPRAEERYRGLFRDLLARVSPRRLEFGVELLLGRARVRADRDRVSREQALGELYAQTRERVEKRVAVMGSCGLAAAPLPPASLPAIPRFVCDPSLGGLARWLRAAGYEAVAVSGTDAAAALREAERTGATLLTSVGRLLERRAIVQGVVPVVLVPTSGRPPEQLVRVLRARGLRLRDPRCMGCGASLHRVPREQVQDRIPPRTARWKDEYFVCGGCDQLFWKGTHWARIEAALSPLAG